MLSKLQNNQNCFKGKLTFPLHFTLILILGICVETALSYPTYDIYDVENEPDPIRLSNLVDTLNVELKGSQISSNKGLELDESKKKRSPHDSRMNLADEELAGGTSCCPTVIEVIQPTHGKNRMGDLVELYQSPFVRQRFYETSCAPEVDNRPCRYLAPHHLSSSRCVQQYSHTYAMVRDVGSEADWKLDYIQIRSGCSCHVKPLHY